MSEAPELALPAVVDGKYRVGALLGEGAMGSVYSAEHVLLGHRVAIKFLRTSVDTETVRSRFIREAKATMALRSEHIVRVFDLGVLSSKTPYMVLEYLEGTDLRALIRQRGALPVEEAVDYAIQACEALAEAHANGIVHRDLKPQNLFRTRLANGSACIKLLDFGVSKFEEHAPSDHELTTSQVLLGSPALISPEQIRSSSRVDARADVWSLGIVLYMLLGGGKPFEGDGLTSLCASIMVDPPRPLAGRCPEVPKELESVIFSCLEKSRDLRMPTVAQLASALAPFASAEGRLRAERIDRAYGAVLQCVPGPPSARDSARLGTTAEAPSEVTSGDATLARTSVESVAERTSTALATPIGLHTAGSDPAPLPSRSDVQRAKRRFALAALTGLGVVLLGSAATFALTRTAPTRAAPPAVAALTDEPEPSSDVSTTAESTPAVESSASAESVAAGAAPVASSPNKDGSARTRRGVSPKRSPAARPASKKSPQVDRNGVPILE